jgi:hypothetical protein
MNADILSQIFSYINDGYTYKTTIFTCKNWYNIINDKHPNLWRKCCHMLSTILKFYPKKPWTSRFTRGFALCAKVGWNFILPSVDARGAMRQS